MTDIVIDFSDVKTFEPIPVDWYEVEVKDARVGKSQAGNAKITLQLRVVGGEHNGRALITDLVLEGDGRWKTKQAFEALLGEAEGQVQLSTDDFKGATCSVRVTQRVWREEDGGDGTVRNNISSFKSSTGSADELEGLFTDSPDEAEDLVTRGVAEELAAAPKQRKLFGR